MEVIAKSLLLQFRFLLATTDVICKVVKFSDYFKMPIVLTYNDVRLNAYLVFFFVGGGNRGPLWAFFLIGTLPLFIVHTLRPHVNNVILSHIIYNKLFSNDVISLIITLSKTQIFPYYSSYRA